MSEQVNLVATIKDSEEAIKPKEATLRVGGNPDPSNTLILSIENKGDEIKSTAGKTPNLYLKGQLGQVADALFSTKDDARNCTITKPAGWNCEWDFPNDNVFHLKIFTYNDRLFDKAGSIGDSIKITLSNVISKTAPGSAKLSFASGLSENAQPLEIAKVAEVPDIIYFSSEPEEGVQNLPGDSVTLNWRTSKLEKHELTQVGSPNLLPYQQTSNDVGSYTIPGVSADMAFRLKGYDGARAIERELSIKVLRAGWYDITNILLQGDPGYPVPENEDETKALQEAGKQCSLEPTLLLNGNKIVPDDKKSKPCLYAVFRHIFQEKERAFLFQTTNPFGPWKFVKSSVRGQSADIRIPDGFSTSPGVYFDDKLWLIGGSQIDRDIVSDLVWCYDPNIGIWEKWGAAGWPARMGHGVLVFQNKIWVMGGLNASGNALNDVWTLDLNSRKWNPLKPKQNQEQEQEQKQACWSARCLVNPTVFGNSIWLYGGAKEPSSAELFDDLYVFSYVEGAENYTFEKKPITAAITGEASRKPIASCLQVFGNKLHLFGKFRTTAVDGSRLDEPLGFFLSDPSTGTWERFPSDGLGTWGTHTTFSYQAVNYRDKMLIAKALPARTREPNPILKIYIP